MSRADTYNYVCQRAAHAIISEVGYFRISSDALQTVNQFLDEFLAILLSESLSLDLARIKTAVSSLLPTTLGKNAIVEAELEVKTYTESEGVDYNVYERNRALSAGPLGFPLETVLRLVRIRCVAFCALAERDDASSTRNEPVREDDFEISPLVIVYVATVIEHMAEYMLTAIAMTAENEDAQHVRIKEVYLTLVDDEHVSRLFFKMDLRDQMEKRVQSYNIPPHHNVPLSLPTVRTPVPPRVASPEPVRELSLTLNLGGDDELDSFDVDDDIGRVFENSNSQNFRRGSHSKPPPSPSFRPNSVLTSSSSNGTVGSLSRSASQGKKRFNLFKKDRNSMMVDGNKDRSVLSVYDPDTSSMDFEEIIRTNGTVRLSLTPNRLKSIEVKDTLTKEPTIRESSLVNFTPSSPRLSSTSTPRAQTPDPSHLSRLPTPVKMDPVFDNALREFALQQQQMRAPSPIGRLSSKSSLSEELRSDTITRNESLRDAPKTVMSSISTNALLTPQSSTSSRHSKTLKPTLFEDSGDASRLVNQPPVPRKDDFPDKSVSTPISPLPTRASTMPRIRPLPSTSASSRDELSKPIPILKTNKSIPDLRINDHTHATNSDVLERPSSMAAKRVSMMHSQRREPSTNPALQQNRLSTAGTVGMSIKAWDEKIVQHGTVLPGKHVSRSPSPGGIEQEKEEVMDEALRTTPRKPIDSMVLDKVLKFERAQSTDDVTVFRRDKVPYLQRDPSLFERRLTKSLPMIGRVDVGVQTNPKSILMASGNAMVETHNRTERDSDSGMVDGDEEWFIQDEDWDDIAEEEIAVVEWLLGEA